MGAGSWLPSVAASEAESGSSIHQPFVYVTGPTGGNAGQKDALLRDFEAKGLNHQGRIEV